MIKLFQVCVSVLILITTTTQAATVNVNAIEPEKFIDFKGADNSWIDFQETALEQFQKHINKLAKNLPEDTTLTINITNIDLAGRLQYARTEKIRVIKDLYSPALAFEYYLKDSENNVVANGTASIRDSGFLTSSSNRYRHKALGYEKRLFTKWFNATLMPFEVDQAS